MGTLPGNVPPVPTLDLFKAQNYNAMRQSEAVNVFKTNTNKPLGNCTIIESKPEEMPEEELLFQFKSISDGEDEDN